MYSTFKENNVRLYFIKFILIKKISIISISIYKYRCNMQSDVFVIVQDLDKFFLFLIIKLLKVILKSFEMISDIKIEI